MQVWLALSEWFNGSAEETGEEEEEMEIEKGKARVELKRNTKSKVRRSLTFP